ncbi:hypothetical protein CgunFtcFv8_007862 [Champsocephalus gunnari]|uniref:Uncharacterized protein n=1 Tax=Champsocephalus gunnari TaxID=52237 RepID=A0AAN8D184_CHAGU|nr:hypothetical protein CgunFtcFv8_007862 [Champsocephalus gunnari]
MQIRGDRIEEEQREEEFMRVKILRHKKDEIELEESKGNNDAVVREVGEKVGDSEGQSSDEGNMSDVWNSGDSEREESGTEEQRQKRKDLRFERGLKGQRPFGGRKGETVAIGRDMWEKRSAKAMPITRMDVEKGYLGWGYVGIKM